MIDPAKSLHLMAYTSHFPPSNRKKLCALWIVINTFTARWFCFLIPHGLTNLKFFLRCLRLYLRQSKVCVVLFFPYWEYRWTYWPAISMPYYGGKWEGTVVKRLKQRWNMKGFFGFCFNRKRKKHSLERKMLWDWEDFHFQSLWIVAHETSVKNLIPSVACANVRLCVCLKKNEIEATISCVCAGDNYVFVH